MEPKPFVRLAAIALLVGTFINVAVVLRSGSPDPASPSGDIAKTTDPLRAELARCKALADAAIKDSGCGDAWAKNRARFFRFAGPHEDRKIDLFPTQDHASAPASSASTAPSNSPAPLQWTAVPSSPSR